MSFDQFGFALLTQATSLPASPEDENQGGNAQREANSDDYPYPEGR